MGLQRVRFEDISWGLWGLWRMLLLLTSNWNSRRWERGLPSAMHTFLSRLLLGSCRGQQLQGVSSSPVVS